MLSIFINLLLFFLLLSIIITIHEWGHLMAAKHFGVYCYEFSFGMGPLLWHTKKKETQYSIRAIPMGGFVAMAGETDGDAAYPDAEVPEGTRLTEKKAWQKIIIMLAGVFMNFVLAWVIFSLVLLSQGAIYMSPKSEVASVRENSPAEMAGFEVGDVVTKITKVEDGSSSEVSTYLEMQSFANGYDGEMIYTVQRGEDVIEISVTPEYNEEEGAYLIGISGPSSSEVEVTLVNCWYYGGYEMVTITKLLFQVLGDLFHGSGLDQLSGPVGIYEATSTYASMGIASYMFLVAELSLNVGIMNLLPLPVLDGGQVVITIVEAIVHRPLSNKVKTGIMIACWVLLIGLMVFVTWNDITRVLG